MTLKLALSMKIPGYQVKHVIGKGGMSTVYLAVQESLDREVALKVMAPALVADEDFTKRFLKEGKIVARLDHRNIVTVYDIGAFESYYYMALEYAAGGNLSQYIRKGLTKEYALTILKAIAGALDYAHARGFIHRDVKSANILFRADKTPLLSDFGIAKAAASSGTQLTQAGLAVGTPKYMSPEQTMGKTVTAQSDFYSLGVVFYEMLTGRCPFEGEDSFVIALKHMNEPIPDPPSYCAEFKPILVRMLAKAPADRYSNTQELFSAIDEIRSGRASPLPPAAATQVRNPAIITGGIEGSAAINLIPESEPASNDSLEVEISPQEKLIETAKAARPSLPASAVLDSSITSMLFTPKRLGVGLLALLLIGGGIYYRYTIDVGDTVEINAPVAESQDIKNPTDFVKTRMEHLRNVAAAYQRILQIDSGNAAASEGLAQIADKYEELARDYLATLDPQLLTSLIEQGLKIQPQHPGLLSLKRDMQAASTDTPLSTADRQKIDRLLREAEAHLAAGQFILPPGKNAVENYRKVLSISPDNPTALSRLKEMADLFEQAARNDLENGRVTSGISRIEQGLMIDPQHAGLRKLEQAVKDAKR